MTFFKTKIAPLRRADFKIYQYKNQKKIETPQNKEKCLFKNSLRYLLPIQNSMKHCQLTKSLDPTVNTISKLPASFYTYIIGQWMGEGFN